MTCCFSAQVTLLHHDHYCSSKKLKFLVDFGVFEPLILVGEKKEKAEKKYAGSKITALIRPQSGLNKYD